MSERMVKQIIDISKLEKPLARGTVSTRYNIARLEKVARSDPDNLPTIDVGVVDGRYYPTSGLDVLEACRNASLREIDVRIRQYESKMDAIISHMKEMSGGDCIDPLRIRGVITELGIMGLGVDEALEKINQKDTILGLLVKSNLTDDVLDIFAKFIDVELSDKLPPEIAAVSAPVLYKIGQLEPSYQSVIAQEVITNTLPRPPTTFTWPPPGSVIYMIENTPKPEVHEDPVYAVSEKANDDMLKPEVKTKKEKQKSTNPKNTEPIEIDEEDKKDLHRVAKDCVVHVNEQGKPDMLFHTKNKTIRKITKAAAGKAYKLHENTGRPAHLMPLGHDTDLEVDSRPLHGRTFTNKNNAIEEAIEYLKSLQGNDIKLSILWTAE